MSPNDSIKLSRASPPTSPLTIRPAYPLTPLRADPPLKIVTSLTTYGAIAREIVGDRGTVTSIAQGDEDPHFVQPKPSFVRILRDADLFVTTGMDLELWVPALLDRAGNRRIVEGGPGYVPAYRGIDLLEVPTSVSRAQGDIHAFGNPSRIATSITTAPVCGSTTLVWTASTAGCAAIRRNARLIASVAGGLRTSTG